MIQHRWLPHFWKPGRCRHLNVWIATVSRGRVFGIHDISEWIIFRLRLYVIVVVSFVLINFVRLVCIQLINSWFFNVVLVLRIIIWRLGVVLFLGVRWVQSVECVVAVGLQFVGFSYQGLLIIIIQILLYGRSATDIVVLVLFTLCKLVWIYHSRLSVYWHLLSCSIKLIWLVVSWHDEGLAAVGVINLCCLKPLVFLYSFAYSMFLELFVTVWIKWTDICGRSLLI